MHRKRITKTLSMLLAIAMTCSALMVPNVVLADEETAEEVTEEVAGEAADEAADETGEELITVEVIPEEEVPEDELTALAEEAVPEEAEALEEEPVADPDTYDRDGYLQVTLGKEEELPFAADQGYELTVQQTGFYIIETLDLHIGDPNHKEVNYWIEPVSYEYHFEDGDGIENHYYYLTQGNTFSFVAWVPGLLGGKFCMNYAGPCCYASFENESIEVTLGESISFDIDAESPSGSKSYNWSISCSTGEYALSEYGFVDNRSSLYVPNSSKLFDYDAETGNFYYLAPDGTRAGIVYYSNEYGGPVAEIVCTVTFDVDGRTVAITATEAIVLRASDFDKSVSAIGYDSVYSIKSRYSQPGSWKASQTPVPVTIDATYPNADTEVSYDWYVYSYSGLSQLSDGVVTVSSIEDTEQGERAQFSFDVEQLPLGQFDKYCCKVTFEHDGQTATRMVDVLFDVYRFQPDFYEDSELNFLDEFFSGDGIEFIYYYFEGEADHTYYFDMDYSRAEENGWDTSYKIMCLGSDGWYEIPETSGDKVNYIAEDGMLTLFVDDTLPVIYDDSIPEIADDYVIFKCIATSKDALGNAFAPDSTGCFCVRFRGAPSAYSELPTEYDSSYNIDEYCATVESGSTVELETFLKHFDYEDGDIFCDWSLMDSNGVFNIIADDSKIISRSATYTNSFVLDFDPASYEPTVLYEHDYGNYLLMCHIKFIDQTETYLYYRVTLRGVPNARVLSRSLALDGYIGLNFYLDLPDEFVNDEGAYILVDDIRNEIPAKDTARDRYCVTAKLPAAMMRHDVVVKLIKGDGSMYPLLDTDRNYVPNGYVFSVQDYIDIAKARLDPQKDAALLNMIKYMSEYGMYAQRYFNIDMDKVKTDTSIFFEISALGPDDLSAYAPVINLDGGSGIAFANSTLDLDSATTLSHYFTLDAGKSIEDYVFLVDGTKVTLDSTGRYTLTYVPEKDKYCLAIHNIAAAELDQDYDVEVFDADSEMVVDLQYSALSYVYRALVSYKNMDTTTITEKQAYLFFTVRALYLYYLAAEAYFS